MDEMLVKRYVGLVCDRERHIHPRTYRGIIECAWRFLASHTSIEPPPA
jgi:hypothetical protein